jgi:hypothetical protein
MPTSLTIGELVSRARELYLAEDDWDQSKWLWIVNEIHRDLALASRSFLRKDSSAASPATITFSKTTGEVTFAEDVYELSIVKADGATIPEKDLEEIEVEYGHDTWFTLTGFPWCYYRQSPFVIRFVPLPDSVAQVDAIVYYTPADVLDANDKPLVASALHMGLVYGACYLRALNDLERDGDGQLKAHYSRLYQPYVLKAKELATSRGSQPRMVHQIR